MTECLSAAPRLILQTATECEGLEVDLLRVPLVPDIGPLPGTSLTSQRPNLKFLPCVLGEENASFGGLLLQSVECPATVWIEIPINHQDKDVNRSIPCKDLLEVAPVHCRGHGAKQRVGEDLHLRSWFPHRGHHRLNQGLKNV